jgi:hypothetical protein
VLLLYAWVIYQAYTWKNFLFVCENTPWRKSDGWVPHVHKKPNKISGGALSGTLTKLRIDLLT